MANLFNKCLDRVKDMKTGIFMISVGMNMIVQLLNLIPRKMNSVGTQNLQLIHVFGQMIFLLVFSLEGIQGDTITYHK